MLQSTFNEANAVVLKSWKELVKQYGSFINEYYYSTEEIRIPHIKDDFYVNIEESDVLGKAWLLRPESSSTANIRFLNDSNCTAVIKEMVVKYPNKKEYPELFI